MTVEIVHYVVSHDGAVEITYKTTGSAKLITIRISRRDAAALLDMLQKFSKIIQPTGSA